MRNQNVNLTILNLNHRHLVLPTTPILVNVIVLRGNFTDLEAFMLKNNPDIFALCETNLHDNIQDDFQLPGYLPIHRKDTGHMHGLGVYVKSNLPIARETILGDENESYYVFSFGASTFYYIRHLFSNPLPITPSGFVIPIPLMLQVCFVKSLLWYKASPRL